MGFFSLLQHIEEQRNDAALVAHFTEMESRCFARGEKELVAARSYEVAGYKFLSLQLVGLLKVKTFKGCKVIFHGDGIEMEVDSDTTEIETDYSRKYSLGITAFDLDLDEALEQNLLEQKIKTFTVIIDKYQNTYTIDKPELLVQALEQPADEEQQEIDYTEVEMEEEPEQEEEKPFGEKPSTDPLMP